MDKSPASLETERVLKDRVIEVAAAVVLSNGRVLITRRPSGVHLGGLWEFPGGKRDHDETYEACLRRELREELGIEVAIGEELNRVRHDYPDRRVSIRFFLCHWLQGDPRSIGCEAVAWVTALEIGNYPFPPADLPVLRRLEDPSDPIYG